MWLSLLPWGFVLLGLLPLWLFPRQESIYPGMVFLVAALILASAASLYARAPLGPQVRLFWVLGLGVMSSVVAVAASRDLAQVPEDMAVMAAVASLLGACMFLLGLFFLLRREVPGLPTPRQMGFHHHDGVMPYAALQALAPSLESLSAVRPVTLLLLHTRSDQPGAELLQYLRQPDMVFQLKPGQFLIALQGSDLEGAQIVFRRIRQNLVIRAYGVLPLQGMSLQQALVQLQGELEHFYLTQH
ncbi:diguanylate cyclase [Meiothermus sp.]|uniref:diguanylate cyclase n=1 Tax=Meiothermus sp. TaxID=1955249 RepID=UPI0026109368|nr:diguanylate cyclase [Meiothermus sp.]